MELGDSQLMERVLAGDAAAFDTLFERYNAPVYRGLLQIVTDQTAADDLLQEVFLRLWTKAEQWQGRGTVLAYLLRIATNLALNYLRSTRRRRWQSIRIPDEGKEEGENPVPSWMIDNASAGPDEIMETAEERKRFYLLTDELPEH